VRGSQDVLYTRLSKLEVYLADIEKKKQKNDEEITTKVEKEKAKYRRQEIKDVIRRKDYTKALSMSKKFVYDFQ
jgi:hypothetical protein